MKISITPFELNFKTPLKITPSLEIASTARAWVDFDYDGPLLRGELATLPQFLALDLKQASALALKVSVNAGAKLDLTRPYFNLLTGPQDSQILFAFECALFASLNLPTKNDILPHRKLLVALESEIPLGVTAAKIKVARSHLERELEYVAKFIDLNPSALIRLDPNQLLQTQEVELLKDFCHTRPQVSLELSHHEHGAHDYGSIPLYYDGNIQELSQAARHQFVGLVYKPARDGGLSGFFKLATAMKIEMSSTYESAATLKIMADACRLIGAIGPHGLGTKDLLKNP